MAGQRPQHDVFVSREIEPGKNFYAKIRAAWDVAKRRHSINPRRHTSRWPYELLFTFLWFRDGSRKV
jgi:hypothetical protein